MSDKVFRIDTSKISNPIARIGAGISRPLIERTLCFPRLNTIHDKAGEMTPPGGLFADGILDAMNVSVDVNGPENPFAAEGPVVVVANHPYGGIEGVLLISLLMKYRQDSKVMANFILSMIPELRDNFFFVDPFGGAGSKQANMKSVKSCLKWLQDGHVLGAFPAGEVSSVDLKTGKVRDPMWQPMIARFIRKTNATVVPVFFSGHNGVMFNLAGLIHPRLRTLMLPKQFVNKRAHKFHIEIGNPITPRDMADYADDDQLIQYLRLRTYVLGERPTAKKGGPKAAYQKNTKKEKAVPVVAPVSPDMMDLELKGLPESAHMFTQDEYEVYCTSADRIPSCLRELGRLREITFRATGEGTNLEIDLDSYDTYYRHLFIWNSYKKEIVGAYRLGLADEIMDTLGVKGLYSRTCFKYDERLVRQFLPAIELGRSFIRQEYQKSFGPLMFLWKGICVFMSRNPKYKTLFGPVSISNDYLDTSRNMIIRSFTLSNFGNELARLVKPRHRPRRIRKSEWNLPDYCRYIDNFALVSDMIEDIESDQKGVPVLLRQYLKMGGRILAFNVDPDFNYSLDGLIAVDVPKCDPKVIRRYMGADAYEEYMSHHRDAPRQ